MSKEKKKRKKKQVAGKKLAALKTFGQDALVADVIAAALVATASALKDSKRARALAVDAADELAQLSKTGAERGSALWDMAVQIGRRSLEALAGDEPQKPVKAKTKPKAKSDAKSKIATKKSRKKQSARAGGR